MKTAMFWRLFRRHFCYKPRIVTVNNTAASHIKVSRGQTAFDQIAFFAFHTFVVEDSIMSKNRVRAKLQNCCACVFNSNVEIRIAGSSGRPQLHRG